MDANISEHNLDILPWYWYNLLVRREARSQTVLRTGIDLSLDFYKREAARTLWRTKQEIHV